MTKITKDIGWLVQNSLSGTDVILKDFNILLDLIGEGGMEKDGDTSAKLVASIYELGTEIK